MVEMNRNVTYWILFISHWLLYLYDQWIKWRQYRLHLKTKSCPFEINELITAEEFSTARNRAIKIGKFNFVKDFLVQSIFMIIFFSGYLPPFWKWIDETSKGENSSTFQMIIFVVAVTGILMIPLIIGHNCCIQYSKNGYDTDSIVWFLFGDIPIHSTMFSFSLLIFAFAIWFSKKIGEYFYIYLWQMSAIFIVLNVSVVYTFIFILAPCIFDGSEMPESVLKQEIKAMAVKCKHPMTKICLDEKFKTNKNRNACIYGFPKNKRMVIFRNLINNENFDVNEDGTHEELTTNEILGILVHEICFWNSRLPLFILFIGIPYLFICYCLFGFLYQNQYLFETFGFTNSEPIFIGAALTLTVIFPIFNRPFSKFIRTYFRRRSILIADEFAAKYGYSEALQGALIKLAKNNSKQKDVFPINDILYSNYFCPQPTIFDRIQNLKKLINDSNQDIQLIEINSA